MTPEGWSEGLARQVRRRPRAVLVFVAAAVAVSAASAAWTMARTTALVSADPDRLAGRPDLVAFALPRGHRGFATYCAPCHGRAARGDPALGIPDLTDQDWLYGSGKVSEIETIISDGVRAPDPKTWKLARMPAYARLVPYPPEPALQPLAPGDIRDVVSFLMSIEGRGPVSEASARGRAIFAGRGGCYDCHGADAGGDPGVGAPNLADHTWLYGSGQPEEIFDSIAYGRAGVCPAWRGRLKPAQVREIALYVHALSTPSASASVGVQ